MRVKNKEQNKKLFTLKEYKVFKSYQNDILKFHFGKHKIFAKYSFCQFIFRLRFINLFIFSLFNSYLFVNCSLF